MNYPCLKCVLEYLEANQRFRLSSRCPTIRKIERLIPLHLELLDINSTTIRINDCRYRPKKKAIIHEQRVLPEDTVLENQRSSGDYGYYYRILCSSRDIPQYDRGYDDEKEIYKVFPEGVRFHDAMRWLGHHLFERRQEITTRKLVLVAIDVLRLPVDFKIKVGILDTSMGYLDGISKFINPKVDTFIFSAYTVDYMPNHDLIRNAKKLCVMTGALTHLPNIAHKNVELQEPLRLRKYVLERLIRHWITDGREIGSKLSFNLENDNAGLKTLLDFKKCFGGRTIFTHMETLSNENPKDLDALRKELMKSHGLKDGTDIQYSICLPISSISELQISLLKGYERLYSDRIVMEVVPLDFWPTLETDHVERELEKEKIKNFEHNMRKEKFRKGFALIIFLIVLLCLIGGIYSLYDFAVLEAAKNSCKPL